MDYKTGKLESAKSYLEKVLKIVGSDAGIVKARCNKVVIKG